MPREEQRMAAKSKILRSKINQRRALVVPGCHDALSAMIIEIEKAVKEITGPLSVNLMDAVTGVKTELIPIPELARMGVARVSIPVASILVAHKACLAFFNSLKRSDSGILKGQHEWLTSFDDYTRFIGLPEYKALEKKYLPEKRILEKYSD
jgi:2-methylisocitrate lyase-like PEP mutase family enzyme